MKTADFLFTGGFGLFFLMADSCFAEADLIMLHHNPFNKSEILNLPMDIDNKSAQDRSNDLTSLPQLQAILLSDNLPMVIVDEHILSVGKEVNGYKLLSVEKDGAVFEKANRSYTVKLKDIQLNQYELE
jgi:hypothetical protein